MGWHVRQHCGHGCADRCGMTADRSTAAHCSGPAAAAVHAKKSSPPLTAAAGRSQQIILQCACCSWLGQLIALHHVHPLHHLHSTLFASPLSPPPQPWQSCVHWSRLPRPTAPPCCGRRLPCCWAAGTRRRRWGCRHRRQSCVLWSCRRSGAEGNICEALRRWLKTAPVFKPCLRRLNDRPT